MMPFKILRMRPAAAGGGGGAMVAITDQYLEGQGNAVIAKTVSYRIMTDGKVYMGVSRNTNGQMDYTELETWLLSGVVANYQVKATVTSGTLTSGVTTWQSCSTLNEWFVTADPGNTKTTYITVEIRDTATSTVRDSAAVVLAALNGDP
jgi:hypothetical protein